MPTQASSRFLEVQEHVNHLRQQREQHQRYLQQVHARAIYPSLRMIAATKSLRGSMPHPLPHDAISVTAPAAAAAPVPPPQTDPRLDDLSPRQRETLDYLLQGRSVKEAARAMHLSPHTVHLHVTALYKKFDVHSRAELLARFLPQHSRN
jgi:DNA-binding NarL/FixJ family response regulator